MSNSESSGCRFAVFDDSNSSMSQFIRQLSILVDDSSSTLNTIHSSCKLELQAVQGDC